MRQLDSHKVNPVNDLVSVTVIETPSGEPVSYQLDTPNGVKTVLNFQNGPIGEVGVNGITNEALLAIIVDRLSFFQKSQFACRENALAITKLEEGMHWLLARTLSRMRMKSSLPIVGYGKQPDKHGSF